MSPRIVAGYIAPVFHRDGSVDYWCPRRQDMVRHVRAVPYDALAILPDDVAQRVRDHIEPHRARPAETLDAFVRRTMRRIARECGVPITMLRKTA